MCVCVLWALRVQQLLLHIQQQWLQHQRQQQQTAMAGAIWFIRNKLGNAYMAAFCGK